MYFIVIYDAQKVNDHEPLEPLKQLQRLVVSHRLPKFYIPAA